MPARRRSNLRGIIILFKQQHRNLSPQQHLDIQLEFDRLRQPKFRKYRARFCLAPPRWRPSSARSLQQPAKRSQD